MANRSLASLRGVLPLAFVSACRPPAPDAPQSTSSPPPSGWEGFYAPEQVTDAWLESRRIPLSESVVRAPLSRVAKLVIADGVREAGGAELDRMERRYCAQTDVRAWNEDRCEALSKRECNETGCRYEHFGNCSGLLAGGGLYVTAAHCVDALIEDPALAARSAVLTLGEGGRPGRKLPLGPIRVGKSDFAHHWVALDDQDPVDVAAIVIDDGGLPPHPTAALPKEGGPLFIIGFPRVNGRDDNAMREAGYSAIRGTPSMSFGRLDDRNDDDLPLCNVDGNQEHWALRADCPGEPMGDTWRGEILRSPFLTTFDSVNGYSGGPIFDAEGRWVGINATLISRTDPQTAYDPDARMVATPVGRALARLGLQTEHIHGPRITVRPQTADEAFDYLWWLLGRMPFFRDNGYDVALPADETFAAIASGDSDLAEVDREQLRRHFANHIYDPTAFAPALTQLRRLPRIMGGVLPQFERWREQWGFVVHERYEVVLTSYGPGGSYDPQSGTVTLFARPDGTFKGGGGPQTVVHEMVHLGVDGPIVEQLGLEHWEKERLVDLVCALRFAEVLGGYPLQGRGGRALDPYVDDEALSTLPSAIRRYVEAHPRTQ